MACCGLVFLLAHGSCSDWAFWFLGCRLAVFDVVRAWAFWFLGCRLAVFGVVCAWAATLVPGLALILPGGVARGVVGHLGVQSSCFFFLNKAKVVTSVFSCQVISWIFLP